MNEKVSSSSSSGYLILSKLHDSSYVLKVGFPEDKWPDQTFKVDVGAKDRGFLLKNFGEKGWGLFDLQTMTVIMAEQDNKATRTELKEVSAFTEILSKAANDPSLKEKTIDVQPAVAIEDVKGDAKEPATAVQKKDREVPTPTIEARDTSHSIVSVVKKEIEPVTIQEKANEEKTTEQPAGSDSLIKKEGQSFASREKQAPTTEAATQIVEKVDTSVIPMNQVTTVQKEQTISAEKEDAPVVSEAYKPSVVKRKAESSTTEGFGLTFIDEYANGEQDTIHILIPNPEPVYRIVSKQPAKENKGPEFLDISTAKDTSVSSLNSTGNVVAKKQTQLISCTSVADEKDFMKLRRRMAGENDDQGMIDQAVKYFKSKCFSVTQVKNLSTLFLNDEGKYRFFDAAYTALVDRENFSLLSAELKDPHYINLFNSISR